MQRERIDLAEAERLPIPSGVCANVMAAVAADNFEAHLLEAVEPVLPAAGFNILSIRTEGRADLISASEQPQFPAIRWTREYLERGADRLDRQVRWLARRPRPERAQLWIARQHASDIERAELRQHYYDDRGIFERLTLMRIDPSGERLAINFFRLTSMKPLGVRWRVGISGLAPLLAAAARANARLRTHATGDRRQAVLARLSGREREIISLMLDGRANKEIAWRLGISETTALTYRYRALRRLGLRTQRDLFATALSD